MSVPPTHVPRMAITLRRGELVRPLELFFDLVFVLAITQCTALMAHDPTWGGIGRGLLVLGLLRWSWVGYAWLTSVVDPDEGPVRLVLFAAMAALLVTSLCVPDAYGASGVIFAIAYGAVRSAHIALFVLASRDDPGLRHSVVGFGVSTAIGIAVLVLGATFDGNARAAVWAVALVFDMAGPVFIDPGGWRLVPDAGVIAASVLGIAVACALWWAYFDVSAPAAAHRLAQAEEGSIRNRLARDGFSYLHLPMVAAIVLIALAMKSTLTHVEQPLEWETAAALAGGGALYFLAHVGFKLRALGTLGVHRMVAAAALLAFLPVARRVDAVVSVAVVAFLLWATIALEAVRHAEARRTIRHAEHLRHQGD